MGQSFSTMQRIRKDFGRIGRVIDIPDLMEMQRGSYERFLQKDVPPEKREDAGLQGVFKSVFPIKDFSGTSSLEFVHYTFGEPKYSVEECLQRDMTYEAPIKITVRLVSYDVDKDTGTQSIRDIKEQEIYFGAIPLMTARGTFIINGTERVIVSQLQRSPGIFFDHDQGKTHSSGKVLYSARIIPVRGSWVDFEFDHKDILYVRIDRRRKFPVTTLLKALGYSTEQLLEYFYRAETIFIDQGGIKKRFVPELFIGKKAVRDLVDPKTNEVIVKKNRKITKMVAKKIEDAQIETIPLDFEDIKGSIMARDLIDPATGEVLISCNEEITEDNFQLIKERNIPVIETLYIDGVNVGSSLRDTMLLDRVNTPEEAIMDIYRRLRPSSIPTSEIANTFFNSLFFSPETYDLSDVGRYKLNLRLKMDSSFTGRTLRKEDILEAVRYLIKLKDTQGPVDDIDHLGNRRVRAVGELIENQYRIGLVRMERAIKERMSLQEIEAAMPHDLINPKPVSSAVKEFFGTSQLSQFMDQTNPLSEITHERRLSALGPGGLSRERAGFEVRDVHPTHYGRICPVETPEGPNIGLIVSLSTYAKVNHYGFIETPYREVTNGVVTKKVRYLSALDEQDHAIAQANAPIDTKGRFLRDIVSARRDGEFVMVRPEEVTFMDVSPNQLVSVAASLIPFLENDDANRALMGSNMQRQAVPLLKASAPVIGTGLEGVVARDSGATVVARGYGYVEEVDANRIVVRYEDEEVSRRPAGVEIYRLTKFQKSNQSTCINQKPIVRKGDFVNPGQIIADGPATEKGELALGKNVMVAFMPWGGCNFEDSILVSERLVMDDVFTSIHIEQFETVARDTKLGKEEITRDIPNVGEEALKDLDESGIVRIGAEVKAGDILVGKVTPKGETQLSPEEKLLRAIFGEKAGDVKDTSLRVPPGIEGIVIDAKVFSRRGVDKDERARSIEDEEITRLRRDEADELAIVEKNTRSRLERLLVGGKAAVSLKDIKGKIAVRKGEEITAIALARIPLHKIRDITFPEKTKIEPEIEKILDNHEEQVALIKMVFNDRVNRFKKGDELPPGVIKMVKVYVATKRKLSVGDKMAGRHGNKGVVSRIMPVENMPYFEDGTPMDIVLNPLGVPSRMNVGQVLETHLGWAAKGLGEQIGNLIDNCQVAALRKKLKAIFSSEQYKKLFGDMNDEELLKFAGDYRSGVHMATPVFDGAEESDIRELLAEAGVSELARATLYDGRTGETFEQKVTVGIMYMMKLHHLVDDKIHARCTGPYSLVTQQPLGGKAQFGGQRLGEMEVWAMEAYGAAYSLQEFLTVKSDDVSGRTRMYEKIVKGSNTLEAGLPESFNVLIKELQGLSLDVELIEKE
ncbi:MAG: DNA-directed RNA polymerase subunit beta [Thermodesulfobacteriota bacterium]